MIDLLWSYRPCWIGTPRADGIILEQSSGTEPHSIATPPPGCEPTVLAVMKTLPVFINRLTCGYLHYSPLPPCLSNTCPQLSNSLLDTMTKDYQRLWKDVTSSTDEAQPVQTLAEILADKEGRAFVSRLDSNDAELCIKILGNVSRHLYFPFSPPHGPSGYRRVQPQIRREAGLLRHVEETL